MKRTINENSKYSQSYYTPLNPHKYRGKTPIRCMSSWERKVCHFFDTNDFVLFWASESVQIPYIHPFKPKNRNRAIYHPDFLVVYMDHRGTQHKEIVEVKPAREAYAAKARTKKDKINLVINSAKWEAAKAFAAANGFTFRVITEADIFKGQ